MDDWKHVILAPDEILLLRPIGTMTLEELVDRFDGLPDNLRGRVIALDSDSVDVTIVRKLD